MKLFVDMSEQEIENINLIEFTGLKIGDKVTHKNAGLDGGNATKISFQTGTVLAHQNQGLHHWGGLCATVTVLWDDGEKYDMIHTLAKKI